MPEQVTNDPQQLELWQAALRHLTDGPINFLYPLDRVHVIRMLRDLHAVGERPDVKQFTKYAKQLWPPWGSSERWTRDRWREILRNPRHRFRIMHGFEYGAQPFYLLDHLTKKHGLESIESRLGRVARAALDSYRQKATEGSRQEFDDARKEVDDVLLSIVRLRRARFGDPLVDR